MPTPGERRALIFIAAIAALGVAVRGLKEMRGAADRAGDDDRAALARQIEAVDSAVVVGGVDRAARGGRGKRPSAKKVRSRTDTAGSGNAMPPEWPPTSRYPSEWFAPGKPPRDLRAAYRARRAVVDSAAAESREREAEPRRRSRARAGASAGDRTSSRRAEPVDLDTAAERDIAALPWIGPALARRIVIDRVQRGPFGSLTELERIPGVSGALTRRLQPYVTFPLPPRLGSTVESWPRSRSGRRAPP